MIDKTTPLPRFIHPDSESSADKLRFIVKHGVMFRPALHADLAFLFSSMGLEDLRTHREALDLLISMKEQL